MSEDWKKAIGIVGEGGNETLKKGQIHGRKFG